MSESTKGCRYSAIHEEVATGGKRTVSPAAPTVLRQQILDLDRQLAHANASRMVHRRRHGGGEAGEDRLKCWGDTPTV